MSKLVKITGVIAFILMSTFGSAAFAACTTADVSNSKWRIFTEIEINNNDYVTHCFIAFPSTAAIGTVTNLASTSSCRVIGQSVSFPVTGSLIMSSSCSLTGNITIKTSSTSSIKRLVDAWVSSPGKDSIVGRAWDANAVYHGGVWSGVRQQ